MEADHRRRSISRHSSRTSRSRSISRTRTRRHRKRSTSDSRSSSRSLERRSHRRKRSVSRSRSRDRRRHRSRSRTRHHYHRSSKKRSRSRDRSNTKRSSKYDKEMEKRTEKSKKHTQKRTDYNTESNDSDNHNRDSPEQQYRDYDDDEPIDKERIHREIEQKLRETLAREGKVYPPKKPEASHPVFANDGSFLEIFKQIQEQSAAVAGTSGSAIPIAAGSAIIPSHVMCTSPTTAAYVAATASGRAAPPPPMVGRRRGGKILKTGVVTKQKINVDGTNADPKDFWALYLAEVNKYKNTACESETGNRPLVK